MSDVFEFLEGTQERLGVAETFKRACSFMMAYLSLFQVAIPSVASDALEIARLFHLGRATVEDLEVARVRCWEFLDAKSASTDFTEKENCAIRAVICFLYASPPSEDVSELVMWFLTLANKVEDHTADVDSLLKEHF